MTTQTWTAANSPYSGVALLVHLNLAARADAAETAHVSIGGVAAETGAANDDVARALQRLTDDGWIVPDRSGGGHYRLTDQHGTIGAGGTVAG